MSQAKSQVYQENFQKPNLHRLTSLQTEWQTSKSHRNGYSVEQFTGKLLHSNSTASSGYWEDCESLGASAHEIEQTSQFTLQRPTDHHQSCATLNHCQSLERSNSDSIKPKHQNYSFSNRPNSFQNSFDEDDRPRSPNAVAIKISGPQIQMNGSLEKLPIQTSYNQNKSKFGESSTINNEVILHRKCSAPTPTTYASYQMCYNVDGDSKDEAGNRIITEQRRATLFSNTDFSDSDEEEDYATELIADRPEPRTLFEAALRRARLADSQREINNASQNATGRQMPDWGSPIGHRRLNSDIPPLIHCPRKTEEKPSDTGSRHCENDGSESSLSSEEIKESEIGCPELTCNSQNKDWCTDMETWLRSRSRWLYQVKTIDKSTLQLCYMSESDEEMWTSVDHEQSFAEEAELSSCEADRGQLCHVEPKVDYIEQAFDLEKPDNKPLKENKASMANVIGGLLFRDENELGHIKSRLGKVDQYCELYFKQMANDCDTFEERKELNILEEKCRSTQRDVQFSLLQANKIARVQLELERPAWVVVPHHLAKTLQINVKNRTVLPQSVLTKLKTTHLQLVFNSLCSVTEDLNKCLMDSLMERDELNLEHGAKLVELDDLIARFKEICIRVSNRQYRKQIMAHESEILRTDHDLSISHPQIKRHVSYSGPLGQTQPGISRYQQSNRRSSLTFKQRLLSAFSR